jgi:hypothetical protein
MPLVHFSHSFDRIPADAIELRAEHAGAGWNRYDPEGKTSADRWVECPGPKVIWLWKSHVGVCLREYEHNMRDDSDFFMVVWNAEKGAPETIMFATTRGWSYPSLASSVDATPEVQAAYKAWCERKEAEARHARKVERVRARLARRAALSAAVKAHGLPGSAAILLRKRLVEARQDMAAKLLTSKLRSEFKLSLRAQLLAWFDNPAKQTPFSNKQWDCLAPREPGRYW